MGGGPGATLIRGRTVCRIDSQLDGLNPSGEFVVLHREIDEPDPAVVCGRMTVPGSGLPPVQDHLAQAKQFCQLLLILPQQPRIGPQPP